MTEIEKIIRHNINASLIHDDRIADLVEALDKHFAAHQLELISWIEGVIGRQKPYKGGNYSYWEGGKYLRKELRQALQAKRKELASQTKGAGIVSEHLHYWRLLKLVNDSVSEFYCTGCLEIRTRVGHGPATIKALGGEDG